MYRGDYHCVRPRRHARCRNAEDVHSPPTAHRGSPIACERFRRDTESSTQSQYWYLRANIADFTRLSREEGSLVDSTHAIVSLCTIEAIVVGARKCARDFAANLRQNISSSRALTFPCFLIIEMSLPSALSRATPGKRMPCVGISTTNAYIASSLLFRRVYFAARSKRLSVFLRWTRHPVRDENHFSNIIIFTIIANLLVTFSFVVCIFLF